jgi:hypothetical protein
MLAAVTTAFVDGLAVHAAIDGSANPRVAYDVFWLALLGWRSSGAPTRSAPARFSPPTPPPSFAACRPPPCA